MYAGAILLPVEMAVAELAAIAAVRVFEVSVPLRAEAASLIEIVLPVTAPVLEPELGRRSASRTTAVLERPVAIVRVLPVALAVTPAGLCVRHGGYSSANAAVRRIRVDFIWVTSPRWTRHANRPGTAEAIKRPRSAGCHTCRVKRDKRKSGNLPAGSKPGAVKLPFRPPIDRRHALVGVVILLALFTYSNSFRAPFLMDNAEILSDTRLHSATSANIARIVNGPYHQAIITNLYRPLTSLSYMYNYAERNGARTPARSTISISCCMP